MIGVKTRRRVKDLIRAGKTQTEVAGLEGISLSTVKRIVREQNVAAFDDAAERRKRRIGRPSIVKEFRGHVATLLGSEPTMKSNEVLEYTKHYGYKGGKSAMYDLIASIRRKQEESNNSRAAPAQKKVDVMACDTDSTGNPRASPARVTQDMRDRPLRLQPGPLIAPRGFADGD